MDGVRDLPQLTQPFIAVVPAKAGTHNHGLWNVGPGLRGDDRSLFIALDASGRRPEK